MLSKRYESNEVDRKTWLHVPSVKALILLVFSEKIVPVSNFGFQINKT